MKIKIRFLTGFIFIFSSLFLLAGVSPPEARLKKGDNSLLIENFPYVPQAHQNTCGAASLAMLLQYYGIQTSEEDLIKEYPQIHQTGFHIPWLWEYSQKKGLKSESGIGTIEKIKDFIGNDTPVIVYQFSYKGGIQHFRVVIGYDDKNEVFIVNDPAWQVGERSKISYADFEELWQLPYFTSQTEVRRKFYFVIVR